MIARNQAIEACLEGKLHCEDLLDLIEFYGLDPSLYVDVVEDNINYVINNQIVVDGSNELLFYRDKF